MRMDRPDAGEIRANFNGKCDTNRDLPRGGRRRRAATSALAAEDADRRWSASAATPTAALPGAA